MKEMAGVRLPARSTRGKRINNLLEEDDSDDESFWNQEAWQEEMQDDDYESEEEEEDVIDSDFHDSESEEDDAEVVVREDKKRKAMKPPGSKKPLPKISTKKAKPPPSPSEAGLKEAMSPRLREALSPRLRARATGIPAPIPAQPRAMRRSTQQRTAEALREQAVKEKERIAREKRLKKRPKVEEKVLTQVEMLEEAAQTEIENIASLQKMIAREEETKAKAMGTKKAYVGPLIKYRSFRQDDEARVTLTLRHMKLPPHMEPQRAPIPPQKPLCVITGLVAKWRDPKTGLPYANLNAFKELRKRYGQAPPQPQPQHVN